MTVCSCKRKRERCSERDDTADTSEREHERPLPGWRRVLALDRRNMPTWEIRGGIQPNEAGNDYHAADDGGGDSQLRQRIIANSGNQGAGLQTSDEEHHAFDQICQEVPEKHALEPRR